MVLAENLLKVLYQMAANHDQLAFVILVICIVLITLGIGYTSFNLLLHKSFPPPIASVFLIFVPVIIATVFGSSLLEHQFHKRKPRIGKEFPEQKNSNQGKSGSLTNTIL